MTITVKMHVLGFDCTPPLVTITGPRDAVLRVVALTYGLESGEHTRIVTDIEGREVVVDRNDYSDPRGHHGPILALVV